MIKLTCKQCYYSYEITEQEMIDNGELHTHCLLCGGENEIKNLNEILEKDIYTKVKEYVDLWVKEFGWDYTIDLIKKYKDVYAVGRLYVEELKRRGINIKGD